MRQGAGISNAQGAGISDAQGAGISNAQGAGTANGPATLHGSERPPTPHRFKRATRTHGTQFWEIHNAGFQGKDAE